MAITGSKSLYLQVLAAVLLGVLLGHLYPDIAVQMQPLGDAFVRLVRMVIAPIIFITVVVGIAKLTNTAGVGRIGLKAILYFEGLTTVAMLIGLAVGHVFEPGLGVNADPGALKAGAVARYVDPKSHQSVTDFLMNIIPDQVVNAFAKGDILPVLFFAVLFGVALAKVGERGSTLVKILDQAGAAMFGVVALIMRVAPLGAFGAMAFAIGRYGIGTLSNLLYLMLAFYATCVVFVFVVLGLIMAACGLNLINLLRYLKEEFFIVLGTSSSESALPTLMEKLENMGCSRPLVGLVVPLGYAFNLDGTSIYFTMAIAYISQALNIPLSATDYLTILTVLLLTSKGAAAVTGGGFITLAATLGTLAGKIPVESIVLVFPIDRFMSEARAITNLFGNAVATIVVAKWEGQLDLPRARAVLSRHTVPELVSHADA
jgi:aerobic C4-dicarboxylate transport protein